MADRSDEKRSGDVLGLGDVRGGGTDIGGAPLAHETDEEQRRRRMREGADEMVTGTGATPRGNGATGIDMGAGGEGTDIEP
jgi:hypothetical protein